MRTVTEVRTFGGGGRGIREYEDERRAEAVSF
jgi:hypothetical protein